MRRSRLYPINAAMIRRRALHHPNEETIATPMRHHVTLLSLSLLALAACKDPNAGVPRATSSAATTAAPSAPAAGSEHLVFAPPTSSLGFTGAKVTGSHNGTFGAFNGAIDLDAAHPENSRISVTIETASVSTDQDRLTNHLKSPDFFDVARFPRATFESTAIRVADTNGATHTVTGTLSLHGQSRSITFPATIAVGASEVTARSEFVINRRDFGLVYPGMPDNLIRDEVTIRFDLRAPRAAH